MKLTRILLILLIVTGGLCLRVVSASPHGNAIIQKPDDLFANDPLPPVSEVVPGYVGPGAPRATDTGSPSPEPKEPRDYLIEALERAGCDDECQRDLERQAKFIGLVLLIAIIVFALRVRSEETLSPPGSANQYRHDEKRRRQ